jgi:hypothetical protein
MDAIGENLRVLRVIAASTSVAIDPQVSGMGVCLPSLGPMLMRGRLVCEV